MVKKKPSNFISLIVPAYRQEATIVRDIQSVKKIMDNVRYPFEIIVVVDGELEKTREILDSAQIAKVKTVGYSHNHGKGYAVRFGMARAKGNLIAFIDAGMDLNPEGIRTLLEDMKQKKADIIIGSKLHPHSKVVYPWQRKILSWGYRSIIHTLFGLSISDTQVGLKLFKRNVLEKVLPRLLVKKYAFDIEMLAVAYSLGYLRIYEAPIELTFNNWSSITSKNFWKTVLSMLWDTFAVFYRLKIVKYYAKGSKRKWRYDPELNFRINVS